MTALTIGTGADVTGLFPRVFNIIRGQLFCGIVSLAIVPWKLLSKWPVLLSWASSRNSDNSLASGSGFISFLGSYNIFIAPICGVSQPFIRRK
jgi:NCS1 family nucleobase:cation symporter-1